MGKVKLLAINEDTLRQHFGSPASNEPGKMLVFTGHEVPRGSGDTSVHFVLLANATGQPEGRATYRWRTGAYGIPGVKSDQDASSSALLDVPPAELSAAFPNADITVCTSVDELASEYTKLRQEVQAADASLRAQWDARQKQFQQRHSGSGKPVLSR